MNHIQAFQAAKLLADGSIRADNLTPDGVVEIAKLLVEHREALSQLLAVSREVWIAIVDHRGPEVLAGRPEVALAFLEAGKRAGAAVGGQS